ncbi:hypothetical protein ScPMuIL_002198 [Solemya velum]
MRSWRFKEERSPFLSHAVSGSVSVVSIVMYSILIMLNLVTAARILHAAMLFNVLHSPMSFLDTILQEGL